MATGSEKLAPQSAFALRTMEEKLNAWRPIAERLPDGRSVAVLTRLDQSLVVFAVPEVVLLLNRAAMALAAVDDAQLTDAQRQTLQDLRGLLRQLEPMTSELIDAPAIH